MECKNTLKMLNYKNLHFIIRFERNQWSAIHCYSQVSPWHYPLLTVDNKLFIMANLIQILLFYLIQWTKLLTDECAQQIVSVVHICVSVRCVYLSPCICQIHTKFHPHRRKILLDFWGILWYVPVNGFNYY